MLKNIILKVIADKKQRSIEPTHALFKDVFDRATIEGIALANRNELKYQSTDANFLKCSYKRKGEK